MKSKALIETNPHLKDPDMRKQLVVRSVRTSCGVEGIKKNQKTNLLEIHRRKDKKIYKKLIS